MPQKRNRLQDPNKWNTGPPETWALKKQKEYNRIKEEARKTRRARGIQK
jgi:hypothetical protein